MPIHVPSTIVASILEQFDLSSELKAISPALSGYRNTVIPLELISGEKLSLIFYKREPKIIERIKRSNQVSSELASRGWPTRKVITSFKNQSIICLKENRKTQYCCLYNYLPGATISWSAYTKKHLKLLGQVLGLLHSDLEDIVSNPKIYFPSQTTILRSNLLKMSNYFGNENVKKALALKLNLTQNPKLWGRFEKLINEVDKLSNQQLLHLDFVRGNILFDQQKSSSIKDELMAHKLCFEFNNSSSKKLLMVTGILDWEKTAVGPKIIDVARTLSFLIIDSLHKTENKVRKYFIYSGYKKRGLQELNHDKYLNPLVELFLFYDFYKFLKHNPYEFLPSNNHFARTKNWLLQHNLLRSLSRK